MKNTVTEVKEVINIIRLELGLNTETFEVYELLDNLKKEVDFTQEIDGNEYRFIQGSHIWDIYKEEIEQITVGCYNMEVPSFLAIDWEQTAQNCFVDGYGHTFSSHDGSEIETVILGDGYYIFRTI